MKIPRIVDAMQYLDDELLADAIAFRKVPLHTRLFHKPLIKACACVAAAALVVGLSVLYLERGDFSSERGAEAASFQVYLYRGDFHTEDATLVDTSSVSAEEGLTLSATADGTDTAVLHIADPNAENDATSSMRLEAAQEYADRELDQASPETAEKILEARRVIIYSKSWVADGYSGYVENPETGERVQLPTFSELFPEWDIPTSEAADITPDGLGSDLLYGISVRVLEVQETYLVCMSAESANLFPIDQQIKVFYPSAFAPTAIQVGDTVFVSYYGKDCSVSSSEITAKAITERAP